MEKNFRDFKGWLNEAISNANTAKAAKLIRSYLQNKTGMKFAGMPGVEQFHNSSMGKGFGIRFFFDGTKSIRFNWAATGFDSNALDSVDVWDGAKREPSWHVSFDRQESLVKVLPLIVDLLQTKFEAGMFTFYPESPLTESRGDIYDPLVDWIVSGVPLSGTDVAKKFSNAGAAIYRDLRNSYPSFFSKSGSGWTFSGSVNDARTLKSGKGQTQSHLGAVNVHIKAPSGIEQYKVRDEYEAMDKDLERIAYEDQIADLNSLVRLVVKGASNALFIAGRGGCLAPSTQIEIYENS